MEEILVAERLRKTFPYQTSSKIKVAADNHSFSVYKGEIFRYCSIPQGRRHHHLGCCHLGFRYRQE